MAATNPFNIQVERGWAIQYDDFSVLVCLPNSLEASIFIWGAISRALHKPRRAPARFCRGGRHPTPDLDF